jgi:hypothetical protein
VQEPQCKRDVQKLLGKVNYLQRFIANLAGKVESVLPLICLKHEVRFEWVMNKGRPLEGLRSIWHHL